MLPVHRSNIEPSRTPCHPTHDTKFIVLLIVAQVPETQTLLFCESRKEWEKVKELKILIADDSTAMREELQRIFSGVLGISVVGAATDGVHALELAHTTKPDVLILDMSMPKANGLKVVQEIRKTNNSMQIIIFSADPAFILREACLRAGANFYLNKSQIDELLAVCQTLRDDS